MQTIYIKSGDECFKSLLMLYESGYGKDIYSVSNNTIIFNNCCFTMIEKTNNENDEQKDGDSYPMDPQKGSPAFANFRRGERGIKTSMARWKELITEVSKSFHKENTWLRYDTTSSEASPEVIKADMNKIKAFLNRFWDERIAKNFEIDYKLNPNASDAITTIYGASLRLGICVERPKEEIPIVGRIFFKRELNNSLVPLPYQVAENISEKLKIFENPNGTSRTTQRGADEDNYDFNHLSTALQEGIQRCIADDSELGLANYLIVKSDRDQNGAIIDDNKIIENIIKKATEEDIKVEEITCKNIKMLYMFQVRTRNRVYEVKYNDRPVLRIMIDMNEDFSIRCLCCNESELLVERNTVTFRKYDENGKEESVERATLDFSDTVNTGLPITDPMYVRVMEKLGDHIKLITCNEANGCKRIKCSCDIVKADAMGDVGNREYCADCEKFEVIYHVDGKPRCTSKLVYDCEKNDLVVAQNGQTCKVCGRTYYQSKLTDGMCEFCQGTDEEQIKKATKLYKIYSEALSPMTRLTHLFAEKGCFEDEEVIVFKLGNDYYTIDKLQSLGNSKKFLSTAKFKYRVMTEKKKEPKKQVQE